MKHYPEGHSVGVGMIYDSPEEKELCRLEAKIQFLFRRIMELESIAPKRFKLPDGRVMVWHCPDELIPLVEIPQPPTSPLVAAPQPTKE